jgi:hypothetical protein
MATLKLRIRVVELSNVLLAGFDKIKVYRSTTGYAGVYSEITTPSTRIDLVADQDLYEYIDTSGDTSYWYRYSFYDSVTTNEGSQSIPIQGVGVDGQYCTLQDIRDEGFEDPPYTDSRITTQITLASAAIEAATGQWFEARNMTLSLDGDGTRRLEFEIPIISVTTVTLDDEELELDDLVIYNRHITSGLKRPDDRRNPKIEWNLNQAGLPGQRVVPVPHAFFTLGQQNVVVEGVFGFTEYDGTSTGRTPTMLRHLCKLVTIRELEYLSDPEARNEWRNSGRVSKHKTRDQEISMTAQAQSPVSILANGLLTGDPEIDGLIKYFRAPSRMKAV